MADGHDNVPGRNPHRPQPPTAQQVAAALAILSLAGPMALGGMPVLPVTIEDERRRHQDEIQQASESSVGVYQTSAEAEVGLALSQQRLAGVTREIEDLHTHSVDEQDVVRAARRVFADDVPEHLGRRFRAAFTNVAWDTVDLFILRDNEEYEERQALSQASLV